MSDLDADGVLTTDTGKRIPRLQLTTQMLIDRTIAIFGPSGTGKTAVIKHIMKILNGHIDQILVISPTEPSNRSYEGFVDPPLIHYRLYKPDPNNPKKEDGTRGALRFLEAVWQRAEMMAAIYTRANSPKVLAQLFARLPREVRAKGVGFIQRINKKRRRVVRQLRDQFADEPGRRDEKVKEVNSKFRKMLVLVYKKYIVPAYESLWAQDDLSEDERYSLGFILFNPRMILIFDDCAAQLKPFFSKDIFRRLFYQNRWSFLTVIMSCQDDTDLPTNLRKNAYVSVFTEPIVCMSNFERASNKFPKATKAFVAEVVGDVFRGFRKLAYIREDERRQHFFHITVPYPKVFRFGSSAIHELCAGVQSAGVTMDKENPYFESFKLQ